ncbi:adhesion G-protein coupled receptor G2-like [Polyodon spathula]|uniref:adhesion G-protein coupled receptor G2-like n=1 Tax=Polyodon spathula TaxID=7913 RepID=UPI001B7E4C62|nr:adhesion G-protein coupled receptor G2-like [Polyodon spathula]
MFIVVLVQLCRIKSQKHHTSQRGSSFRDIKSVAGLTFLLGITWGFAFFAWGAVQLAFMYLFAIFNTLQGFFIFVFHCAAKENVRKEWRRNLCCGKLRLAENSDWSRTATNMKKKSAMLVMSFGSGSSSSLHSNITSSGSKTFLVSREHAAPATGNDNHYTERERVSLNTPNGDVMLNEISHDSYKLS